MQAAAINIRAFLANGTYPSTLATIKVLVYCKGGGGAGSPLAGPRGGGGGEGPKAGSSARGGHQLDVVP